MGKVLLVACVITLLAHPNEFRGQGLMDQPDPQNMLQLINSQILNDEEYQRKRKALSRLDHVLQAVNIYDGVDIYQSSLKGFNEHQQAFCGLLWYVREVNNGGHDQFFWNPTAVVWSEAQKGLQILEAEEMENTLTAAITRLSASDPHSCQSRQLRMKQVNPNFDDIDTEFFELNERYDLEGMVARFIEGNLELFPVGNQSTAAGYDK